MVDPYFHMYIFSNVCAKLKEPHAIPVFSTLTAMIDQPCVAMSSGLRTPNSYCPRICSWQCPARKKRSCPALLDYCLINNWKKTQSFHTKLFNNRTRVYAIMQFLNNDQLSVQINSISAYSQINRFWCLKTNGGILVNSLYCKCLRTTCSNWATIVNWFMVKKHDLHHC